MKNKRPKENPVRPASTERGFQNTKQDTLAERVKRNHTRVKATRQAVQALSKLSTACDCIPLFRIRKCSDYLRFNQYHQTGKVKLASANFCKVYKVCSQCAQRRATKLATQTLESIMASHSPSHYYYLLTATVRNGEDIDETNNRLFRYMRILTNRYMRKNKNNSIANKWLGGIWNYETTNNGNGWHPHFHGLIIANSPITVSEFRNEWKDISNGDSFMCDASPINYSDIEQLKKSVFEVCKYAVKNLELSPEHLAEFVIKTKGKQLLRRFGLLSAGNISIEPNLADHKDEPFTSHLFRYFESGYKKMAEEHYQNENDYHTKRNPQHDKMPGTNYE